MRPLSIRCRKSIPIAVSMLGFLMVLSWTVSPASAQDESLQPAVKKGTIHTANKLVLQKYGHYMVTLSGVIYKYTGSTEFLDESGARIPRRSIPLGTLVDIVYVTDKDAAEDYPFNPKDKVLLKVRIVAAASK
ncbi:MAG: hypothetical protein RDU20_20305 [Desulfomonilaceae bacterium]|nr:hypothetical protein [Desulfomonilaceae bacterium]